MGKRDGKQDKLSSAEIRQGYLDYFEARGHTVVPSASLVPGGDQTLLFTNAGMVQFKDVFLGTGERPYSRAVDSQKCMRVAGKHNDLEDVGRDDSHHTFFEMLGNWSFGDYYKEEAITWAWDLLTRVWGLPKDKIWATCFEDELGEIPRDDDAANFWREQPGFDPEHIVFFGREENFWEMADTGPCGPDSEIHLDRGPEYCDMQDSPNHECRVNGDCQRFLELWNLVFIQYNRTSPTDLEPLPNKHVDTGMGFERIVSVIQDVDSNYRTDLFMPLMRTVQQLTGHSDAEREEHFTPYRVIADHARAAAFLIADGVVPGNVGRNYVCRMIIRRASRFGGKIGLNDPFLANVAGTVIERYGHFFKELERNRAAILRTITDEERRFHHTLDMGISQFHSVVESIKMQDLDVIPGERAFDLYATYGLPFEITRDLAQEQGLQTDEEGFYQAMDAHREASSAEQAFEEDAGKQAAFFRKLRDELTTRGELPEGGVEHDPYHGLEIEEKVLALVQDDQLQDRASEGDRVGVVLPRTPFYVEAGGQVSDTGTVVSVEEPRWEIHVEDTHHPVGGLIIHYGRVVRGRPEAGDVAFAAVDETRRWDIMRNHTATHLLHAALRDVLGDHVRQAGSLVAPDRLRFDFTHPEAMKVEQIDRVEMWVNDAILNNYPLEVAHEPRAQAVEEGAMALFGETYGETVRTITIRGDGRVSYELCGGTHVPETGVIGTFLIVSEGSVASGIRRIEAVTGHAALDRIRRQLHALERVAERLEAPIEQVENRLEALLDQRDALLEEKERLKRSQAEQIFSDLEPVQVDGVPVLTGVIPDSGDRILRQLTDRFRSEHPQGVVVLGSSRDGQPIIVAAVGESTAELGVHAGELVKAVAAVVGGSGGGRPTLAQAGGKDASKLSEALSKVIPWVRDKLSAAG